MKTQQHTHRTENADSIEIGTPSKGGAIKVYGDFTKIDEFKKKIDAAFALRDYARSLITEAI
jgi:hypothetical protein